MSIGIAVRQANVSEPDDLIAAADKALYVAKESGRNCVVVAEEQAE